MNKNTKKQILNISFVILLFVIMILMLSNITDELNFSNIKSFLSSSNPLYLGLAILCWILFISFESLSLHIILKKLGHKPKIKSSIAYTTADTYYSAITPSATGGQPASAFYMVRDGIPGGTAGFSLIFNLVGYTTAILLIGIIAFIFGFNNFLLLSGFVKTLIVLGFVLQFFLLLFFILCMCKHTFVKKCCFGIINILCKLKIVRKREKWIERVDSVINKYNSCYKEFKKHKKLLIPVILCNFLQRSSQVLISAFICKAATNCNIVDIFILQSLVLLGYNSIPLPGGSIAYEYLYLSIYGLLFEDSFIVIALMITRAISYYFSLLISGIYTMIYHLLQTKWNKKNIGEKV